MEEGSLHNLHPCSDPKTSFNIGVIEGGTSVNSIAQNASCLLDFRSESTEELDRITEIAETTIAPFQSETNTIPLDVIGHRPAGQLQENHWLKQNLSAKSSLWNLP